VTKTQSHHLITAESGTEDDLETINGGADGEVLLLRADTGDTITLKHDVGNIYNPLGEDVEIADSIYCLLICDGTNWIIYASGYSAAGIQDLIDAAITTHSGAEDPHGDRAYADGLIAAADALIFKGTIDCSGNPNYPAADCGHTYKISVAGKIGGASGITVEIGDTAICTVDSSASGDQAAVGANWVVLQTNIVSAITEFLLTERGSIIYRNATVPAELLHGDDGQVLTSKGHNADPIWAAAGGGDVSNPLTENLDFADFEAENFVAHRVADEAARLALSVKGGKLAFQIDEGALYLYA
jgi:hypothetical protein